MASGRKIAEYRNAEIEAPSIILYNSEGIPNVWATELNSAEQKVGL
jgi:hypothetical protein